MRTLLPLLLLFPLLLAAEDEKLSELLTLDGKFYQDVTIRKVEPDGLSILHKAGAAKVPFEQLPDSMQEKYGYDPDAAAAHRKKVAAAQRAQAAAEKSAREKQAQAASDQAAADADKEFTGKVQKAARMVKITAFQNAKIGLIGDIDVGTPTTEPVKSKLGSTVGHKPGWSFRERAIQGVVASTTGASVGIEVEEDREVIISERTVIRWDGLAWRIGMIEYKSFQGLIYKVPLFTASEKEAAAFYKKNGFGIASEYVTRQAY